MQKIILLILLLAALGVGIASYFFLSKKLAPTPMSILIRESGNVSIKKQNGETESVTIDETKIPNGTIVKTGSDGFAHIIFPDDSMASLSVDTEMEISYSDATTEIMQSLGNAWFRVQKLTGRTFEVESPTTLASVRGTIFGVEIGNEDVAYVTEGEIDVAQIETESGEKTYKNKQSLQVNKLAHIGRGKDGIVSVEELSQAKKDTPWFRRNALFNENFRKLKTRDLIRKVKQDSRLKELDTDFFEKRKQKSASSSATLGNNDPTQLMKKFGSFELDQGDLSSCTFYNSPEFDEALTQLEDNKEFFSSKLGNLFTPLKKMKEFCSDNILNEAEATQIEALFSTEIPQGRIPKNSPR